MTFSTKNYKRVLDFAEVIIRNIVSFFHLGYSKKTFHDVIITSTLHSDK